MSKMMQEFKATIKNPGNLFVHDAKIRSFYKNFCNTLLSYKLQRRKNLIAQLPPLKDELTIPSEKGFKMIPQNFKFDHLQPLLNRCNQIITDPSKVKPKAGKAFLNHLVSIKDLTQFPEFLDFGLNPDILKAVTDYLGELPIFGHVYFWHAHTVDGPWTTSQLYHSDHDDVRQVKLFVFISEVDEASGPLTIIPAAESELIRRKVGYKFGWHMKDEDIKPYVPKNSEYPLIGPKGTVAFVDTSQLFHYGSRIGGKDRYMVVYQYMTLSNFIYNPLYRLSPYPYAHLIRPEHNQIQKAVLDPG